MTRHQQPLDYAPDDNPWDRAHVIPDLDTGPGWREWAAGALIVLAIALAIFFAGWFAHANAMEQTAICIEGCP